MSETDHLLINLEPSQNLFPVVGIGASAGGLDAFRDLIKNIPIDSGMAYIFVQHLSPKFESVLTHILQKVAPIPLIEIVDDITVKPDHIYIIPNNKLLVANDGKLDLHARSDFERQNIIDLFFSSLAEIHSEYAIGVVLSGTGSDGTVGLKTIKDVGGITFAQDEASAGYFAMPKSAIDAGVADYVMSPDQIPLKLMKLTSEFKHRSNLIIPSEKEEQKQLVRQILAVIRSEYSADFTYYKQTTIYRRILRRLGVINIDTLKEYLDYLESHKPEQEALFNDLLIPVTAFFRDEATYQEIENKFLPEIIRNEKDNIRTRIWIAGCSSGEEPYSLAMLILEGFPNDAPPINVQIFATDISEKMITKARSGIYSVKDLAGVSESRRRRFFTRIDRQFQISKQVREICIFAVQNFLSDPPFAKLDMITCRNVLIYMEPYLQQKALTTFHYSLKEGGYLVLGNSETVGTSSQLFETVSAAHKIYRRKPGSGKLMLGATKRQEATIKSIDHHQPKSVATELNQAANEALLNRYGDVGVIINDYMEVVQFRGATGWFLQPPQGKPSMNIIGMAREGLGFELRSLILLAKSEGKTATKSGIVVDDGSTLVNIEVIPLQNTIDPYYFVLFRQSETTKVQNDMQWAIANSVEESDLLGQYRKRLKQLELELARTREDMKAITLDQEAVNEDLQTTNEELLSGAEELQSLNEELETTKEEVESSNEELQLLNQEMIERNGQLLKARTYSEAILATVHEPLLILTRDLKIKSVNKAYCKFFSIDANSIIGHSLFDIQHHVWQSESFIGALNHVFLNQKPVENLEIDIRLDFGVEKTILANAYQVILEEDEGGLLLLALLDVTERKKQREKLEVKAESALQERKVFHDFFLDAPALLAILRGPDLTVEFVNNDWQKFFAGYDMNGSGFGSISEEDKPGKLVELLHSVSNSGNTAVLSEFELAFDSHVHGLKKSYLDLRIQPIKAEGNNLRGVFVFGIDVTEKVLGRKLIETQRNRFEDMIMQSPAFAATLSGKEHTIGLTNMTFRNLFRTGETAGKKFAELFPELVDQNFVQKLDEVSRTGEIYHNNQLRLTLNPSDVNIITLFINVSIQPLFDEDSVVTGLLLLGYDITDQVISDKKNEDNLKQMIESSHQISWTSLANGKFETMNKRFYEFTGIADQDLTDKGWASFISEEQFQAVTDAWNLTVQGGTSFQHEMLIKSKEGSYRWHIAKASPVLNTSRKIILWIGTMTDIHDQKLFAQNLEVQVLERTKELQESNQMLRHSNDSLQQFASVASHDLQEPLRKIKTFTAILNRRFSKNISDEGREVIQKIKRSSDRMSQLVKEVLEYSKVLNGRNDFQRINLQAIFENVIQDLELLISENDVVINQEAHLPEIHAHPLQMNQLFYNLLTNAIKFRQETVSPVINISIQELEAEKISSLEGAPVAVKYVEITFADNGIGFEPRYNEQIFQLFERLHSEDEFEGTGIGLALCKQIMVNHNGQIHATSIPGSGTSIALLFPLHPIHNDKLS